jgi:hypothetical protein
MGFYKGVSSTTSSGSSLAYTESLTIGSDRQVGGNSFEGKIDEFAVYDRELTQEEITRMYNTYYSPNRVANGNFAQIGNEEVTNGDFSQIGSEEVTNGDFATDSSWVKQTGWSIANGLASSDGSQSLPESIYQNGVTVVGKIYKITYTIVSRTSGSVRAMAGTLGGTYQSTPNTYIEYLTATGNVSIGIQANADFVGSIDNVSVKEVGQDWTFGATWSMGDGVANFEGSGSSTTSLYQNNITLTSGKSYNIKFDVSNASGNASIWIGNFLGSVNYFGTSYVNRPNGSYDLYFTMPSTQTSLSFFANQSGSNFTIDNISVKEVGQHWTFNTGWSTDGTKAISDTSSGYVNINQTTSVAINKSYKVSFTLSDYSAGNVQFVIGNSGARPVGQLRSSNGTYTENITVDPSVTIDTGLLAIRGGASGFTGSVDNIVVQELKHDATNLMLNHSEYQSANPLITSTKSMEFDGSDDYLQVGDVGSVKSLSFWFNPDNDITASSSEEKLFGFNTTYYGIALGSQTGAFAGETLTVIPDNSNKTATTKEFDASRWYNIVIAWNETASYFDIYVDGVLSTDLNTGSAHTLVDWSNFKIGTDNSLASEFNGQITETGVWDRTLTALEVASLYNQGMPTNLLVNRNNYQSGNPTVFNTKQVDFDGTDDYLETNKSDFLGTSDFTISGWIKPEDITNNYLLGQSEDTNNRWYVRITSSSYLQFYSKSGGVEQVTVASGGTTISNNEWVHFVITADRGANTIVYVNGIANNTSTNANTSTLSNTGTFRIGSYQFANAYWNGQISQIGIWNEVLTADEVSSLYNHGLPIDLTTNQATYESSSNLVGYWRMGSGTLDTYPLIADQTNATLGSELVTNGDFATDSDWNKGTGWTISNNKANFNTTSNSTIDQDLSITSGKTYRIQITGEITSGGLKLSAASGLGNDYSIALPLDTYYTHDGGTNDIQIRTIGASVGYLDNVSIKEVGGNPAIMTNQTSSDIENGSPYANIVQNGTFDTDSDWTKGTGWSISGGTANAISQGSFVNLSQSNVVESGKIYAITFTISNYVTGEAQPLVGGTSAVGDGTSRSGNGTYTENITSDGTTFYIRGRSFTGSIDNVTVEEVNTGLQGYWKMGDGTNDEYPLIADQTNPNLEEKIVNGGFTTDLSGWTINNWDLSEWTSQGLHLQEAAAGQYATVTQNIPLVVGKTYNYSVTLVQNGAATILLQQGSNTTILSINSSGTYTGTFVASQSGNFGFKNLTGNNADWYISNISLTTLGGNPATMTNMVEGNITNQYPLTKIRNYYRMGDGILDGYPIIQDQTSPNLAHIPTTNMIEYSEDFSQWTTGLFNANSETTSAPNGETVNGYDFGDGYVYIDTANVIVDKTYTNSIYIKANKSATIGLRKGGAGSNLPNADITLTTDWARYEGTSTATSTRTGRFLLDNRTSNGYGVSNLKVFIWHPQLEEQSQATAYIKSDGIAAVRKSSTTNLVPYSEDFTQWTRGGGQQYVTSNYGISPDGTQNADRILFTNSDQSVVFDDVTTSGVTSGSVYVKGTSGKTIRFGINSSESNFTLDGNWQRLEKTRTSSGGVRLSINTYSSATARDILVWGGQLEEQTQAETYAKTTGLPVTIDLFTENNYGTMTNMSASDI